MLKLNFQYVVPKKYVVLITIQWLLPTNRTILSYLVQFFSSRKYNNWKSCIEQERSSIPFCNNRSITWYSIDQVSKKVYNFILACSWLCQYVSGCCVYNSYDFDSDHGLVIADICTPCTKVARCVKWAAISNKKHVNLNCLKQLDISERFINTTLEKLEKLDINPIL